MKRIRDFGVVVLVAITFVGMSFSALFEDEYRLYKMRDPLMNIQYVISVVKESDTLNRALTFFSEGQPVKK